jgi:predicted nucleotidyltransferase
MNKDIKSKLPEIAQLFKHYGAEKAFLFGSAALDQMSGDSDVDFLFQFPKNMDYILYANNYFGLLYDLQDLLKVEVDLLAIETLSNPYLIQKIDSQKIQIV